MTNGGGMRRIAAVFKKARAHGRAALMPYLTLGYPTPEDSLMLVEAAVAGGADVLELGVPFSDPLADGPTIQRATHVALQQGMSVPRCLEMARELRQRGIAQPFILMGYYNPILACGEEAFCHRCRDVGVDGLIVPDLPPDEGGRLEKACRRHDLALVYLLAPTSTPDRVRLVCEQSQGFVYLVSVTGITGARDGLPLDLAAFVGRVREVTDKPLAVGFGISTPRQAEQAAVLADGVIVGSAVLQRAEGANGREEVEAFVTLLRQAVASRHLSGPSL